MTAGGEQGHGNRAIFAAFFANLGIAIAKFVGYVITGSASMLAESIHSVADTGNQALLLLGGRRASKEATPLHPFGFGRERYFWSFVVALVLFTLGSAFAIYEGVHKLQHPEPLESPDRRLSSSSAWRSCSSRSPCGPPSSSPAPSRATTLVAAVRPPGEVPELPVVLLEDIGALDRTVHRLLRHLDRRADRQPEVGRLRHGDHRRAARHHRHLPRRRDEGSAHRRGGRRRRCRSASGGSSRPIPTSLASSTSAPTTSGPTTCSSPARSSSTPNCRGRDLAEAVDRIERSDPRRGPDRRPDLPRARCDPDAQTPAPGGGAGVTP